MTRKRELMAMLAALIVALAGVVFFGYVQSFDSTKSTRIEEPYKRTADKPPEAVPDETGATR